MSVNTYYDGLEDLAIRAVHEAKAVSKCPIHDEVTVSNGNFDAEKLAYAIATKLLKDENGGDLAGREDLLGMVKDQLENACYECPHCESALHD